MTPDQLLLWLTVGERAASLFLRVADALRAAEITDDDLAAARARADAAMADMDAAAASAELDDLEARLAAEESREEPT